LRALKYPNDEARLVLWWMGFPIVMEKNRSAWESRLGKTKLILDSKRHAVLTKNAGPFSEKEDELSAMVGDHVAKLSKHFGLQRDLLIQPSIELFGIVFEADYSPDDSLLDYLRELVAAIGKMSIGDEERIMSEKDFAGLLEFMQGSMTFHAVKDIVAIASHAEMQHAHRRWRALLELAQRISLELGSDDAGKMLAANFGRICVPAIVRLVRDGKLPQLDHSLRVVEAFAAQHDLGGILTATISRRQISDLGKAEMAALLRRLSKIWEYTGFPFSASK
jgi:hypothetical protein